MLYCLICNLTRLNRVMFQCNSRLNRANHLAIAAVMYRQGSRVVEETETTLVYLITRALGISISQRWLIPLARCACAKSEGDLCWLVLLANILKIIK